MQNSVKNQSVSTVFRSNEEGFTLITMLLMISILALTLPYLGYMLTAIKTENNYDELSVQEFHRFIRDQLIESSAFYINENKLHLIQNDKTVVISQYANQIRRQVDDKGHEIYLRDIEQVHFFESAFGIDIFITDLKGEIYEKSFIFYN